MRVLIAHNFYQQPGGEDVVFRAETDLLRARGHEVETWTADNAALAHGAGWRAALESVWNRAAARQLRERAAAMAADVVHFHNVQPRISPAAYRAVRRTGAAVVQTLHNYRAACPGALLYRDGAVCESCVGRALPWAGLAHGCYRGSRSATAAVALGQATHRLLGTWRREVDRYVALTPFAAQLFARAGLPADRIAVKPNFVAAPAPGPERPRSGLLFVGRLTPEKGIRTLLAAHAALAGDVVLRVAGDGPLAGEVARAAAAGRVEWLGACRPAVVRAEMERAALLAFPSRWYEGMPMTVLEAFAAGLPVLASDLGALRDLVVDGSNGARVAPGDAGTWARAIAALLSDGAALRALGAGARRSYEQSYAPARNADQLEAVYREAVACRRARVAV